MSNSDTTIPMATPPLSSSGGNRSQETMLHRGAFGAPATPGTLGKLDRFEILQLLGCGGMGEVYLAREPMTDTLVAIKVMKPEIADEPQSSHRFLIEARHIYRLAHPRILRVLEVSDRKEGPYYVMPYIQGGSLLARFKPGEALSEEFVLAVARQIAEALAHAHAHGLIHRDIKPGNVLLDREDNAFLTDFGLVRTVFEDWAGTAMDFQGGMAAYFSPALARGEAEDTRCDIYAFGALLYEMLAGQPPYSGRSSQIIVNQILKGPPKPIKDLNPKASPTLVKIAEWCMARELHDRYAAMPDVVADLDRIAKGAAPLGPHGEESPFRFSRNTKAVISVVALAGTLAFGLWKLPLGKTKAWDGFSAGENQKQYTYTTNNGALTVTGYIGTDGKATLPDRARGRPVTAVADYAFKGCAGLTDVTIPASVAVLGKEAFAGCVNLKSARFLGNAPGGGAYASLFEGDKETTVYYSPENKGWTETYGGRPTFPCEGDFVIAMSGDTVIIKLYIGSGGEIIIPRTVNRKPVTAIGHNAFANCTTVTGIQMPNSITSIGEDAFRGCTRLRRMNIPSSVTSIAHNPFCGCLSLSFITADVANSAFSNTDGVLFDKKRERLIGYPAGKGGKYVIPDTVTCVGSYAFAACTNITDVLLSNSVTDMSWSVFMGCNALTNVSLSENITSIGERTFMDCARLSTVTIPSSVRIIREYAFEGCRQLTRVYFKGDAPQIDSRAFGYSGATVYYLPGKAGWEPTTVGRPTVMWDGEFQDSEQDEQSLAESGIHDFACLAENGGATITKYTGENETVMIPTKIQGLPVTTIKDEAFQNCPSVTRIVVPTSVTNIGFNAFRNCPRLSRLTLGGISNIPNNMFDGYTNLTHVTLPRNLTTIGNGAFQKCSNVKTILIPEGVTFVGDWAFAGCSSLKYIVIPNTATNLRPHAFRDCTSLSSVTLGNRLTSLGQESFRGCTSLKEISIPANVTDIGWQPFADCRRLTAFRADPFNPNYSSTPDGILWSKDRQRLVLYPAGKTGPYVVPKHVTALGDWSFFGCVGLTDVTIPEGVLTLGGHAFTECVQLKRLEIPASVTGLPGNLAVRCPHLEKVIVSPNNAVYRSDSDGVVFSKDGKTLVCYPRGRKGAYDIPEGVMTIGWFSFEGSPFLTSVSIPESVNNLCGWSFPGCHNLKTVFIPSGVRFIDHCTFYDCYSLEGVFFRGDAPEIHPEWWWSFGGDPIIYHRWDAKGWEGRLAGKATAVWVPEAQGRPTNLVSAAFMPSAAEQRSDWDVALLEYETRYDSQVNDEPMRSTLRTKIAELHAKVATNPDANKAGLWKVQAYAFRELDFRWKDTDKIERHAAWKMNDEEINDIRASLAAFTDLVWKYTSGSLRIEWTLDVIDKPLTKLDGGDTFWPGPWACIPFLPERKPGEADSIMVYVKTHGGQGEMGDVLTTTTPSGHTGVIPETRGATYAGFNAGGKKDTQTVLGEAELREWLHHAKWALEERQCYPCGLIASPYGGHGEGEPGGDYCYVRKMGEEGWLGYYRHIMQDHVTRKMWRELSVRTIPDNVWARQYARQALVLGPFSGEGKPEIGMSHTFIDEAHVLPRLGEKLGDREWKMLPVVETDSRILRIDRVLGWPANSVCYAAVWVWSDVDQRAKVLVGSDNDSRLLQEGTVILTVKQPGGITLDQEVREISLKQGNNLFLLKVSNVYGDWCASFRLTAPDGGPLTTAHYISNADIPKTASFSRATDNGTTNAAGDSLAILSFDPPLPAVLKTGERLTVKVGYTLNSADGVQIWARPYTSGNRTPFYRAHPSPLYKKGKGILDGWFTFNGPTTVDEVRVEMVATDKTVLVSAALPIRAHWAEAPHQ